jgi:hypothetical protein
MVPIDTWQALMSEDRRLRDFRPRTQEGYMAAARQFLAAARGAGSSVQDVGQ